MKLADLSTAEHRQIEVSFHEAGHAVATVLAGGRVVKAALLDDSENAGACEYTDVPEHADHGVAYAGPWTQARWIHGPRPHLSEVLALLASSPLDHAQARCGEGGLPREIENQLETCWPAISKLAGKIYVEGRIDHDDVAAALGMDGSNDNAIRNLVKAGFAPTAFTA